MALVGVAEAARRLGVRAARVHQRIMDGSLPAQRIGSQWVVDEVDVLALVERRQQAGRPLSPRSAWALIIAADVAQGGAPEGGASEGAGWFAGLAAAERSRARRRLEDLLGLAGNERADGLSDQEVDVLAARLRAVLRNRAVRRVYRASAGDLDDLRWDARLVPAGVSRPDSQIAAADLVEGYVDVRQLDDVVEVFLLDAVVRDREANVVLHVVAPDVGVDWRSAAGSQLAMAADLAEHRRPREQAAAADLVRRAASGRGSS
jgi:hypothetical protein